MLRHIFRIKHERPGEYIPSLNTDAGSDFTDREHIMAQAYSKHPIIVNEDRQLKVEMFEWGLIPAYMNTPEKIKKGRSFMCNAQSEKIIHDTKSYWHRIRKNRCLIPVTGIFEHRQVEGFKKMVPYYVHIKDRQIFCIPGLYNIARDEKGNPTGTFTLITRGANSVMEKTHNHGDRSGRMPMFPRDQKMELYWLDPNLTDKGIDDILNYEIPSSHLEDWPVYTIRSPKPRPDDKAKTEPYEWMNLPASGQLPNENSTSK